MPDIVRDIMVRNYDSIQEEAPAESAIKQIMAGKVRRTGYRTVSLMVINELRQLVGIVTMFDILYHLRPTFLNYNIDYDLDGSYIAWETMLDPAIRELKDKQVKEIMSHQLITADPDDHVMAIVNRMVKNRYRRLPVVEDNRLVGVVYIADVFNYLFQNR